MKYDLSVNKKYNRLENTLIKYLVIFYPIIISLGSFISVIDTILSIYLICILAMSCMKKNGFYIKYGIIALILMISMNMYKENVNHIAHIKVLAIFFLAFDCYKNGLYEKIEEILKNNSKTILIQIACVLLINIVFLFIPLGYSVAYSADWGFKAYKGVYADPHQAAYHLCALSVMILCISKNSKKNILLQYIIILGIEYCILMTGARVPTVLSLYILAVFFLKNKIIKFKGFSDFANKIINYFPIIIIAIIALFFCISFTSFGEKIINSKSSTSFDNGRSGLRQTDILLFNNSDFKHKMLGNGTDAVIKNHATKYSNAIWSHNDFLQILCGMGIVIFSLYCIQWLKILVKMIKIKKILGILGVIVCIAVAFYNGMYIHSRFVFVMPLLFSYFISSDSNVNKKDYSLKE